MGNDVRGRLRVSFQSAMGIPNCIPMAEGLDGRARARTRRGMPGGNPGGDGPARMDAGRD